MSQGGGQMVSTGKHSRVSTGWHIQELCMLGIEGRGWRWSQDKGSWEGGCVGLGHEHTLRGQLHSGTESPVNSHQYLRSPHSPLNPRF